MNRLEIKTVKTDGFEMDYFCFGNGSKVFMIIPGLSLRSVMLSAQVIAGAYKDFKKDYTVYVFDRRKNAPAGYSVRDMARDTAAVMKKIGISQADIFGASQGGMIAQYLAIDYPELVHSIVIGSSYSRGNDITKKVFDRWIALAEKKDVPSLNHDFFINIYSDEFLEANVDALPLVEKLGTAQECEQFIIFARACVDFDSYDELEKIKCPVLVIGAGQDKVLTGESSVEMAEKLGCELYIYESAAHAVYDEAPDYKERIMKFFSCM